MNRRILQLLLILMLSFNAFRAVEASVVNVVPDTLTIQPREPGKGFVENYLNKNEFKYSAKASNPGFWQQLFRYLNEKLSFTEKLPFVLKVLMGLFIAAFLLVVILKTRVYRIFYTENEVAAGSQQADFSVGSAVNYDEIIRSETEQEHYRLAVRWLYLKAIQLMRDKEYIRYSKGKTNIDYLYDLSRDDLKSGFLAITIIFNRVWYGETEIDRVLYAGFQEKFQSFFKSLNVQE